MPDQSEVHVSFPISDILLRLEGKIDKIADTLRSDLDALKKSYETEVGVMRERIVKLETGSATQAAVDANAQKLTEHERKARAQTWVLAVTVISSAAMLIVEVLRYIK